MISMKEMLAAGVHYGHQKRYWEPKMAPYIYGVHNKIHIINLEKTLPLFHDALNFISSKAAHRGKILFVGTKYSAQAAIKEEALRCGMPYVNYRWLGGMLTNYKTMRQLIKRYRELEKMRQEGAFQYFTKKEAQQLQREIDKLERSIGGIKDMGGLPDALFIVDVGVEKIAISEAKRLGIPVIAIVDTNYSPDNIDFVIPGNDDASRAIRFYAKTIADVILEAKAAAGVPATEAPAPEKEDDKKEDDVVVSPAVVASPAIADDKEEN
jgi:small subunit ribosomal protein S2